MSKVNQIQNRLLELDGGAFQKLADAYLHRRGYERINPMGSVIGANKARPGTPDSYVSKDNGKYVFAEYTTQRQDLLKKLIGDLRKCLDEGTTGIPLDRIEEIVICHLSNLDSTEEDALREQCQKHGVNLNIFGIGPLSYDLYQKYPNIARDFLGVEIDSGQIVSIDDFVALYNKNALAAPLDITFHFREDDLRRVLDALETNCMVTVTGRPGVGKSRLALECCRQFLAQHTEYKAWCVYNRGVPELYQDLRVYFGEPGHYLILIDDANRINRLDYVLQLLNDQTEEKKVKVVITVRDYAIQKVRDTSDRYGGGQEIEIDNLKDDQIRKLVEAECGIRNQTYQDRIAEIAQGNPRLAIMAAQVARKANTILSISDVSSLYDQYYSSIKKDLDELNNPSLARTAGIVSFFRIIDLTNLAFVSSIEAAFGISRSDLVDATRQLHDLEMCDIYENEVVKVTDQVLSTYLFYLAFVKQGTLSLIDLFDNFFPAMREKFVDAINPVINAFDFDAVVRALRPPVERKWSTLEVAGDGQGLFQLMSVFWFVKETETLVYIQGRLSAIDSEALDLENLPIKAEANIPPESLLSLLKLFRYSSDANNIKIALQLIFEYANKQPRESGHVLYVLEESYGFTHWSYMQGFGLQRSVIDLLWERTHNGKDNLFSRLFIQVSTHFLNTRFQSHDWKVGREIKVTTFQLPAIELLFDLRKTIWERIFLLYEIPRHQKEVIVLFEQYCRSGYKVSDNAIIKKDSEDILPFFSTFDPSVFRQCALVQDYLDKLDASKVEIPYFLRDRFKNKTLSIMEVIVDDWVEKRNPDLSYDQYKKLKRERMEAYFSKYALEDYKSLFIQASEIDSTLDQIHLHYQLEGGLTEVLLVLAERKPELYAEVIAHYFTLDRPLKLYSYPMVEKLVKICGPGQVLGMLNQAHDRRYQWHFDFFACLQDNQIKREYIEAILSLYENAPLNELPHWDYLLKYRIFEPSLFVRVLSILLQKVKRETAFAFALDLLFNPSTEANGILMELFASDIPLLEKAYLVYEDGTQYGDDNGENLSRIMDVDPDFVIEVLDSMYGCTNPSSRHDDSKDFSFVWMRSDYRSVMTSVIDHIYQKEIVEQWYYGSLLELFFRIREKAKDYFRIIEQQDILLNELIKSRHGDQKFMNFLFNAIIYFSQDRLRQFVSIFLNHNKDIEHFKTLPIEPRSGGSIGSRIPVLQKRIEYFESLFMILDSSELLQHKLLIEKHINVLRGEMEREKKRDFMHE